MENENILGLDLGVASVGWALLEGGRDIRALGSRVFEAGTDGGVEKIQRGADESRNAPRREARSIRRQIERRSRRKRKLFGMLQHAGLLPNSAGSTSDERDKLIQELDRALMRADGLPASPDRAHLLPYLLRAKALDEPLRPFELGRAICHLGQRRGYASNRVRSSGKEEEKERGVVEEGIRDLRTEMEEAGARTLGEYFSRLDPRQERIRKKYTSRGMYKSEFDLIWEKQAGFRPELLTAELRKQVSEAIFHQRPLRIQRHLVGKCELEPLRRRAPWALLAAQRFRYVQVVNNLEVLDDYGRGTPLTEGQRETLYEVLEQSAEITFPQAWKKLGMRGKANFNLQRGGEKKLIGNRTAGDIAKAIGVRWDQASKDDRERMVEDLRSIRSRDALAGRARNHWDLDEEAAKKFSQVKLEAGYCSLSRQALEKINPLLEKGLRYAEARKEVYGETLSGGKPLDRLPPVRKVLPELRNPAVERTLTELRKVVNAVIGKWGKPARIHVELARDLKNPRKVRYEISKRNRDIEKERIDAAARITAETGDPKPSRHDKLKVLLAMECDWTCPYTGTHFGMSDLLGDSPQVDIEHILPYSRSLDNSFANKTLCLVEENRLVKGAQTPYEAYSGDAEKYEAILQRVGEFKSRLRGEKLRRFEVQELDGDEFAARHLNDTRYASKLATRYLELLYGIGADRKGERKVQASKGQITAVLRGQWDLNSILNDGATSNGGKVMKTREDHRHHAVDALVIALTTPAVVKKFSDARAEAERHGRRRADFSDQGPDVEAVRKKVEEIVVSHRVRRRARGRLHEAMLYTAPIEEGEHKGKVKIRKPLKDMSAKEVEAIVDPTVRKLVTEKLEELRKTKPEKNFASPENLPLLPNRKGDPMPIRSARIYKSDAVVGIGSGVRERHVITGSNHHLEIFARLDDEGDETKWEGKLVTLLEAVGRVGRKVPLVGRDHGPGTVFKFSLAPGEIMELDEEDGERGLYVVRTISHIKTRNSSRSYPTVEFVKIDDARKKKDIKDPKSSGKWRTALLNPLRELKCRKVTVDPIGEVHPARD